MQAIRGIFLGVLSLIVILSAGKNAVAGCEKDTDCKGDRLCFEGKCMTPEGATTAEKTGVPATASPGVAPSPQPTQYPQQPTPYGQQQGPYYGQPQAPYGAPTQQPPPAKAAEPGRPVMAIGYVFDGFGFAGILVGCVLGFTSPFQLLFWSPLLTTIGAGSLSIGSLLLSSAYTYRHGRYRDLGYLPDGTPRTASWVMTGLVWGFSAASIGMSAYAWKMPCCSNDSEKYFLGGAGLSLGALALEILNVILVRQNMWVDALKKAPRTKIAPPVFYPTISPTQPIAKEKSVPVVGMGILF